MKPFENPSNLVKDPRGMTYGKAAALAAGTLALAYYIAARRDTRVLPSEDAHRTDVMRPDRGTAQQVATDRYGQQHRKPPPSKKDS